MPARGPMAGAPCKPKRAAPSGGADPDTRPGTWLLHCCAAVSVEREILPLCCHAACRGLPFSVTDSPTESRAGPVRGRCRGAPRCARCPAHALLAAGLGRWHYYYSSQLSRYSTSDGRIGAGQCVSQHSRVGRDKDICKFTCDKAIANSRV